MRGARSISPGSTSPPRDRTLRSATARTTSPGPNEAPPEGPDTESPEVYLEYAAQRARLRVQPPEPAALPGPRDLQPTAGADLPTLLVQSAGPPSAARVRLCPGRASGGVNGLDRAPDLASGLAQGAAVSGLSGLPSGGLGQGGSAPELGLGQGSAVSGLPSGGLVPGGLAPVAAGLGQGSAVSGLGSGLAQGSLVSSAASLEATAERLGMVSRATSAPAGFNALRLGAHTKLGPQGTGSTAGLPARVHVHQPPNDSPGSQQGRGGLGSPGPMLSVDGAGPASIGARTGRTSASSKCIGIEKALR